MQKVMKTMLKTVILSVLAGISYLANGQNITIVKNDSTELSILVIAHTTKELRTNANEHILFTDIARASFPSFDQKRDGVLAFRMKAAGVKVTGLSTQQTTTLMQPAIQQEITIEQLTASIEQFRSQRQTGKAIQFIGIAGTIGAGIWAANDTKGKDTEAIKNLMIGSGVAWMIGFTIDWDAGRHLRLRK